MRNPRGRLYTEPRISPKGVSHVRSDRTVFCMLLAATLFGPSFDEGATVKQ